MGFHHVSSLGQRKGLMSLTEVNKPRIRPNRKLFRKSGPSSHLLYIWNHRTQLNSSFQIVTSHLLYLKSTFVFLFTSYSGNSYEIVLNLKSVEHYLEIFFPEIVWQIQRNLIVYTTGEGMGGWSLSSEPLYWQRYKGNLLYSIKMARHYHSRNPVKLQTTHIYVEQLTYPWVRQESNSHNCTVR